MSDKNCFKIGAFDFQIDLPKSKLKREGDELVDFRIVGKESIFEALCADEFELDWGLYPPELYLDGVILNGPETTVSDDYSEKNYDSGIYYLEHWNLSGVIYDLEILIKFKGQTKINGKDYDIEMVINL
jgi:hypothetical protein